MVRLVVVQNAFDGDGRQARGQAIAQIKEETERTYARKGRDIVKKNFEAIVLGWQLGRDPDNYAMWHSSQQKEGQYNFCGYENAQVDRWLVEARGTFDLEKRRDLYHRIHAQIAEDLPYIFLYCPDELVAIHKRFRGPEVAPLGLAWNFREWWVPKGEQRYPGGDPDGAVEAAARGVERPSLECCSSTAIKP